MADPDNRQASAMAFHRLEGREPESDRPNGARTWRKSLPKHTLTGSLLGRRSKAGVLQEAGGIRIQGD